MASHWNVKCDGCELMHLVYYRYKCLRCVNYDLCRLCYDNKVENGEHSRTHPFQCLLDVAAREIHFSGSDVPDLLADSFTCPFCGNMGHTAKELVKHLQSKHRGDHSMVLCPLCVAVPSANTLPISDLVNHVSLMHGTTISRVGSGGGGATYAGVAQNAAGLQLSPLAHHQSYSRGHSHLHSYAHFHAHSLAHAHTNSHFNTHVRGSGRRYGPDYYTESTGSTWPLGMSSSDSQVEDIFSESWFANPSSVSRSMRTMRGINRRQLGAPLASEETCSELDSPD